MKKEIIIFIVAVIILTASLVLFSICQTRNPEKNIGPAPVLPRAKTEERVTRQPRQLKPSRPEDYGITVLNESNKPKTQEQWDALMHKKIQESKLQVSPDTWVKVKATIKEDPKKTQDKIRQIDESIRKCRETLDKDPGNQEVKDRLKRLMMLRSIAKELPNS